VPEQSDTATSFGTSIPCQSGSRNWRSRCSFASCQALPLFAQDRIHRDPAASDEAADYWCETSCAEQVY